LTAASDAIHHNHHSEHPAEHLFALPLGGGQLPIWMYGPWWETTQLLWMRAATIGVILDTFILDTFILDTFIRDTFILDTFILDTFILDTFILDTFISRCLHVDCVLFDW